MATLVLTVIGDDQAGLVEALAGVIADHDGNWEQCHMTQLVGKFAGIVMVTVPDNSADALVADLEPLEAKGLLDISVKRAASAETGASHRLLSLELVGVDHPGIVRDISHALAERNVGIEDLRSEITSA
ncbi:MAG: amino acid-binding ACT protein, partial [Acidimicrobiia bacterium]|nr:amino acid-binding ACT protein [Acidimicrobiia bacterium]